MRFSYQSNGNVSAIKLKVVTSSNALNTFSHTCIDLSVIKLTSVQQSGKHSAQISSGAKKNDALAC